LVIVEMAVSRSRWRAAESLAVSAALLLLSFAAAAGFSFLRFLMVITAGSIG